MIQEDFNPKVGDTVVDGCTGAFGSDDRNRKGDR